MSIAHKVASEKFPTRLLNFTYESLAAGVALFLVGCAFHFLVPLAVPSLRIAFEDTALFRPWLGWTRYYMVIHPFVYGFVFTAGFRVLRRVAARGLGIRGGLAYGAAVFLVGSLPVYLLAFASFNVSLAVIACWILQSLAQYTVAGMTLGCVCDGATVQVSSSLPADESMVWERLLRKDTFLFITRGMMHYIGADQWPEVLFIEGAVLPMRVRLFGWAPSMPHTVEVIRVDENQREIETSESGGAVRVWRHRMQVRPDSGDNCRYTDTIELHAGVATPFVWLFAAVFYRYRQRRWRRWLETNTCSPGGSPPPLA